MAFEELIVPLETATTRQILLALLVGQRNTEITLSEVVTHMTDVNSSLQGLTDAVTEVAGEVGGLSTNLSEAIAAERAAQEARDAALANDATDAARIAELEQELADAHANVDSVVSAVDAQAQRLRDIVPTPAPEPEPEV
jgi:hypothetical protein